MKHHPNCQPSLVLVRYGPFVSSAVDCTCGLAEHEHRSVADVDRDVADAALDAQAWEANVR